jgi:hypothetical protein
MIHSRLQTELIQEESLSSVVGDDPVDDHLSEKIENENVSDCVKFIRTANCKRLPNSKLSLGAILQIFLIPDRVLGVLQREVSQDSSIMA